MESLFPEDDEFSFLFDSDIDPDSLDNVPKEILMI